MATVKLGRNDLCACGSGLKYKHCCWQKEFAPTPAAKSHDGAVPRALAWLNERHRKAFRVALDRLTAGLCGAEEQAVLAHLDRPTRDGIDINLMEWLLAEGDIAIAGVPHRISDCLLGRGGPLLTVGQRHWLHQLAQFPLRLYDVTDVVPGVQITLCDALDMRREPVVVREHSGSQTLQVGTKAAFRVVPVDGHHELSGAAYPFSLLMGPVIVAGLHEAEAKCRNTSDLPRQLSRAILREWLRQYVAPPPMPSIMDAYSGESIRRITDHYRVTDWQQLSDALQRHADVRGDRNNGWERLLDCDDGQTRCIATITAGKQADRIEVFYKTERYADAGRTWFDALAGQATTYLTRELTNPWKGSERTPGPSAARSLDIDPEAMAAIIEQATRRTYANWADEPIPALGNQTPRAAMRNPAGLERVKGLLRSYEDGEERQAAEQGRREISYQFLWDALGLSG